MSQSPRQVHVLQVAWLPPHSQGGYRTRVIEETRLLTAFGHRVDLAAFTPPGIKGNGTASQTLQAELQRATGASVHVLPTSHFFDLSSSRESESEIVDPLARLVRDRSVHIIHGQACYAATWARQVTERVPGLRLVFDCHGISPEETRMTEGHERRALAVEQFEHQLLCSADLVVLVSKRMAGYLESKYDLKIANQLLLPCCVDLAKFDHHAETQARSILGLDGQHTIIGYAGTLAEWQWPRAMFHLFARIRERLASAHLLLLVPQRDHDQAAALLKEAGVPADHHTLREIPNAEIGRVLAAMHAGLLLRQDHPVNVVSSPTKFGEYMAAGVPVIGTDAIGDFSDWIEERQVGILMHGSSEEISAEDLDRVCFFLQEVKSQGQCWQNRCRQLATERLNWRTRIEDLVRAYRSLLPDRPTAAEESFNSNTLAANPAPRLIAGAATMVGSSSRSSARQRPIRLLFNGHDLKFIQNFISHFSDHANYEVQIDEWSGHNIFDSDRAEKMLNWADVIFCEWCLGNARWYSQRKRPGQRLFIRLHHQEMGLPYRFELAWDSVDALLFTNFKHLDTFQREQPEHADKAIPVFCDVSCDTLDQPKLPGARFNLGLVGINPMRKRPDLAVEILNRVREHDPRYTLFFKTRMPWEYWWLWERPEEREYFAEFFESIETGPHRNAAGFDAHGLDMPQWYSKVGFILSTSDHEGSHQAVAEGMAAGCIPVIRDWAGATPLYPDLFVFSDVEQAVELILGCGQRDEYELHQSQAKAYARVNFDTEVIVGQLDAMFTGTPIDRASLPAARMRATCTEQRRTVTP